MRYKAEAFDVWQYLCGMTYDPLIRCRIDLGGRIDEETLRRAITVSLGTIPMMGCCFDGSGRKPYWVDKGFSGKDMVRIVVAGEDAKSEILREYASRIDVCAEPQLKIIIVRSGAGDTLCAIVSHLVCDAMGFKQYLRLVADIYTALLHGEEPPMPRRYPRSTKPLYTQTGLLQRVRILRTPEPVHDYSLKDQPGVDFPSGDSDTWMEYRTVSQRDFAEFKAFTKANGATINDGLMAMYARAFCRETNTTHIAFTSTIDWRRFIPPGVPYGITNYAGNCSCGIPIEPDDSLETTLGRVSQQMQAYKTGKFSLRGAIGWDFARRLFSYSYLKKKYATVLAMARIAFTNLGILDAAGLDFDGLPIRSATMTASVKSPPYLQLTASTFEGSCTLSCNICGPSEEKIFVDKILDDIVADIAAISTRTSGDGGI